MAINSQLRVVLLMHGKTDYNAENRLQSPKDSLTDEGKNQIISLKDLLFSFKFNKMFSSNEKRAVESAKLISSLLDLKYESTPLIKEKSSGEFADRLVKDVDWSAVKGDLYNKKVPGRESINDVRDRAVKFLRLLDSFSQSDSVLVVSHGSFIRILYCAIFDLDMEKTILDYDLPNAGCIVLNRDDSKRWHIEGSDLFKRNIV